VPILRDSVSDAGEYFTVTLSNPTNGARLDNQNSAQVNVFE
jgi:hypothetical protein